MSVDDFVGVLVLSVVADLCGSGENFGVVVLEDSAAAFGGVSIFYLAFFVKLYQIPDAHLFPYDLIAAVKYRNWIDALGTDDGHSIAHLVLDVHGLHLEWLVGD